MKKYFANRVPLENQQNIVSDELFWASATVLTDFHFPWEPESGLPVISFKALHADHWLYLNFRVEDNNIKMFVDKNEKDEVINGDRVEIFFRIDENLLPYYCLEVDPVGRIYDYKVGHYRKFDTEWSWPAEALDVTASRDALGYSVFFAVSKQSLLELGLLKDNEMEVGLFRGKCVRAAVEPEMRWISWVNPSSPEPDFHIPSSFGKLILK